MNDSQQKMTIGELADAAGVTVRTIRYYINEGLLPPPAQTGRYTLYEPWYLDRLELIRRWKDAFLPLKEIRTRIEPLSNAEVRRMLNLTDHQPVMQSLAAAKQAAEQAPWEGQAAPDAPAAPEKALDYIHALQQGEEPPKKTREEIADYLRRARTESRRNVHPTPVPAPTPRPGSPATEWRRIEVLPGFELHLTEAVARRYAPELEMLLDWISLHFPPHHKLIAKE